MRPDFKRSTGLTDRDKPAFSGAGNLSGGSLQISVVPKQKA